ncbi:MAG: ribonuclease H-like domain-containing protein [Candidatus Krumholzibacteriota bacterium]|nr:ribonuclease H-like domain-containing protein [Candidatus Krumholzibacteriota bacterium]
MSADGRLAGVLEDLARLRRTHDALRPAALDRLWPETPAAATLAELVGAAEAANARGRCLRRDVDVEARLAHLRGLGAALVAGLPETDVLAGLAGDADRLPSARAEELLFLDLETTGLHRGIIVMIGFMTLGPGELPLTVTQLFARDFDEEAAVLAAFLPELARRGFLVTFNGRSFDAPFLVSRLRFHGFLAPLAFSHLDLLHLSRRLWKRRLPDCRLQTLERWVLGRRRLNDVAGSEVPRVWEDFVRFGDLTHLSGIWEHNLRDLATLAELLLRAAREMPAAVAADVPPV